MGYDVIVIGAGHAGCEAALACARTGLKTLCFVLNTDSIAYLACNPAVGGTSKGHLVREVDALGGQIGLTTDETLLQMRMLNLRKGPAVHSLRAQVDKQQYALAMRRILENQENLCLLQAEAAELLLENGKISGVKSAFGLCYYAPAVVICSGVYLNSRIIVGEYTAQTGPNGLIRSTLLRNSLEGLGIPLRRFKTGTPPRVDKRTIDFSKMEIQHGDEPVIPFSFLTDPKKFDGFVQQPCYLCYTHRGDARYPQKQPASQPAVQRNDRRDGHAVLSEHRRQSRALCGQGAPPVVHRARGASYAGNVRAGVFPPLCRWKSRSGRWPPFREWKTRASCARAMPSNMTASTGGACSFP